MSGVGCCIGIQVVKLLCSLFLIQFYTLLFEKQEKWSLLPVFRIFRCFTNFLYREGCFILSLKNCGKCGKRERSFSVLPFFFCTNRKYPIGAKYALVTRNVQLRKWFTTVYAFIKSKNKKNKERRKGKGSLYFFLYFPLFSSFSPISIIFNIYNRNYSLYREVYKIGENRKIKENKGKQRKIPERPYFASFSLSSGTTSSSISSRSFQP